MPAALSTAPRRHVTLVFCMLLHGFTHAYGTALIPLYLLMVSDLKLGGVKDAVLIVTVYSFVYFIFSYVAGVLADRYNRKVLLGLGLLVNALAICAMGFTRQFEMLIVLGVVAGLAGTFYHPASNALSTAHFPGKTGMAIGVLGIGSGIGFFVGPQYAGSRAGSAEIAGSNWLGISSWQLPLVELGMVGVAFSILFLMLAQEVPHAHGAAEIKRLHPPLGRAMRWRIVRIACVLGWRDFAGSAVISLASIFLQKAHHLDVKRTGLILGSMMLLSVVVNPLTIWLSGPKRRLSALVFNVLLGAVVLAIVPFWSLGGVLILLVAYYTVALGSYALSDAAILERVEPNIRGRIVGLFLTIAGTLGSIGPWVVGFWVDQLGARDAQASSYYPIFIAMSVLMLVSLLAIPMIARLGEAGGNPPIKPAEEIMPATVGVSP